MSPSPQNPRRQVYIQGSFQRQFVLQFCGVVFIGCALFGVILYYYSSHTLTTAFSHSRLHVMSTAEFLLPALGLTALTVSALVAAATALRVLIFSHRIAGPLYRLEKTVQAMGQGDLSMRVHLRNRDELKGFAQSLDKAVADLRRRIQEVSESSEKVGRLVERIQREPTVPPKLVEELQDIRAQMDEAIARFKV